MNAIEIEEAVSALASAPSDLEEFPFAFLSAFGNKDVTIRKLRASGRASSNKSDIPNGVLQRLNIHIATSSEHNLEDTLRALRDSPQTTKAKAKYILATDGAQIVSEEITTGETLSCAYNALGDHFGFFLALAGISVVRELKDNPIDIKATSRLNKLYVELLKNNPEWGHADRQIAFNQFLARLVFCFFAEDTGVFTESDMFTRCVSQMTEPDGSNTNEVLQELFNAMNSDPRNGGRKPTVKAWADRFPYVNGGLFADSTDCPVFTRTARSYLIRAGELDWQSINPDIFGSMIQAVADDEERGSLGMHYTSVPNIEKVLNPLFLDSLKEQLKSSGDNARKLLNVRKRLAQIRVFDPACGSGNFLVIAYIRLREIEAELMRRRGESVKESSIKLTQFYGIEIKPFAVEIARLSLLIAEFQCNVRLIGQMQAQMLILPLHETGHVIADNALSVDWEEVCPPNEGCETYICGNPPYLGSTWQSVAQKAELGSIFNGRARNWKSLDYVCGWFMKASDYGSSNAVSSAFVSTNSVCQGQQVPILWPAIFSNGTKIFFAYTSFKWTNLASHNAGVIVVVIGVTRLDPAEKKLYFKNDTDDAQSQSVGYINAYLVPNIDVIVSKRSSPFHDLATMSFGNKPVDNGNLLLTRQEVQDLSLTDVQCSKLIRRIYGSSEFIKGLERYCIWIEDRHVEEALQVAAIRKRVEAVKLKRKESPDAGANKMADKPHQFREMYFGKSHTLAIPRVSSESREYLPVGLLPHGAVVTDLAFALYDAPLWNLALLASRVHLIWIATVCGKMKTDYRYSNTMGWNTFPTPPLTENNKRDLTLSAENILLAREANFPATIAELYKTGATPEDLRAAHEHNDETLERIYIGRRFRNDTERLETLFSLYSQMSEELA